MRFKKTTSVQYTIELTPIETVGLRDVLAHFSDSTLEGAGLAELEEELRNELGDSDLYPEFNEHSAFMLKSVK